MRAQKLQKLHETNRPLSLKIFLKQNSTDIDAVQESFRISEGEKSFLLSAKKGSMLIKLNDDDIIATAMPSDFEKDLISNDKVVNGDKKS